MKSEIKQKWLNALRNGEYSQGRYQLRDDCNHFCCLGVLCDLYLKETNQEWIDGNGQFDYFIPSKNGDAGEVLTQEVIEWADLKELNPTIDTGYRKKQISELNDFENLSFDEIADLIESQL